MTTTLPLEVIFHSIDIGLYNHPPTLRILSLTCHAIRSYIHIYLYRTVTLWVGHWRRLASNVPGFLAIIGRSPTILSKIRSLDLILGTDMSNPDEQQIAEVDVLCSVMQQELPNITSVHLTIGERALDRVNQMPQFRTSLSQLLGNPTLSKLTVWGHTSFDLSLLENATHVVNFTIQTVPFSTNNSAANAVTQSPPRLRPTTFTLYNPPFNSAALSSAYCDLTAVSTFRIYGIAFPLRAIPGYFTKFSSTLTRLEMYLTTYQTYYGRGDPHPLILSALFNLRHLTLTLAAKFDDGQLTLNSAKDFQWIIDALCSLPRLNGIESIKIFTRSNTLDYLRSIDWALFDSSVFGLETPAKWASLKALDMVFFMHGKRDLTPLVIEFQDVWIPGTLLNFREIRDAVLDVRCKTGQSIMNYAPEEIYLL